MKVTEAVLLDYLEGRLSATEQAQVEAYLARHPELREEVERMRALTPVLQSIDAPPTPAGFAAQVSARLDQAVAQRNRIRTKVLLARTTLIGVGIYVLTVILGISVLLAADLPLVQPFATLLRILISVLDQLFEPFMTLVRVLIVQPLSWLVLLLASGVVVAWSVLVRRVLSPSPVLAKP